MHLSNTQLIFFTSNSQMSILSQKLSVFSENVTRLLTDFINFPLERNCRKLLDTVRTGQKWTQSEQVKTGHSQNRSTMNYFDRAEILLKVALNTINQIKSNLTVHEINSIESR
jgi:hypothetical protein